MKRQLNGSAGAVLVEYALVLGLLLFASFGAIRYLDRESTAEVDRQADCIATRPPPPSCQPRAVSTTTTLVGTPTSNPTTTTVAPIPAASWELLLPSVDTGEGQWTATVLFSVAFPGVEGDPPTPVPGVELMAEVEVNTGGPIPPLFFVSCITGEDGTCVLEFTTPFPDVTRMVFRNAEVGPPAAGDLDPLWLEAFPP